MTEDHYRRLVAMLLDTVDAQSAQIDALLETAQTQAERIAELEAQTVSDKLLE